LSEIQAQNHEGAYSDSFKAVLQQQIQEVLLNHPGGAQILANMVP